MDTIFALASGRGRAGVAVIRLSGPKAHEIIAALCGSVPAARQASLRKIRWQGEVLDQALVLTFAEGASFTGEASAEIHVHGGLAVIDAVFGALRSFEAIRLAEAGEFTRRALEKGRLELFEVEGLVDLIDAETEGQRRQAQRILRGDLSAKVSAWRGTLLTAIALVEATIDFADEDVPENVWPEVSRLLQDLADGLTKELSSVKAAERVRGGFEVAVFGPPNVGKSSLINALVGRDVAMTSDIAGTTRDIIEARLELGGLPVVLLDTAGLRDASDVIEQEGVRRARRRVQEADLRVLVLDEEHRGWEEERVADLRVSSKVDLGYRMKDSIGVSVKTGEGLDELRKALTDRLVQLASVAGVVVNERHRSGVAGAERAIRDAIAAIASGAPIELIAAHLREAQRFLAALVGKIGVEDVLGEIFGRFCIGK